MNADDDLDFRSERDPAADALAAKRYRAMQSARLAALALAIIGVVMVGRAPANDSYGGTLLVVAGAVAFFAIPRILAKRWKSRS